MNPLHTSLINYAFVINNIKPEQVHKCADNINQFGAFLFGARQFDACQFGAFHFDAVPVRRVSVWRDASLARFTLARFPFLCLNCTEVFSTSVWHVSRFAHIC